MLSHPQLPTMRIRLLSVSVFLLFSMGGLVQASTFVATRLSTFGASGTGNGQFNFPQAMAVNRTSGLIYVSDSNNHRIQVFTLAGAYVGQFGSMGTGNGQFSDQAGNLGGNAVSRALRARPFSEMCRPLL